MRFSNSLQPTRRFLRFFVLASATVLFASTATRADETWSAFKFTTGVDYTSGDYGTGSDTNILFIPFTAKYEHGAWFGGVTIPYIRIESDGSVVGGADGTVITKKNGKIGIYACTLVDDDPDYDFGQSLEESLKIRVMLKHHRCYSCFAFGSSCSEN